MISPGFGIEVVLVARGRWIHFIFCVHDFPFRCECTSALQCFLILCQKYLLYPVKQRRQKKNLVFSLPIVTFVKILKSRTIRPASILIFDCYLFFISLISFSIFILCWFPWIKAECDLHSQPRKHNYVLLLNLFCVTLKTRKFQQEIIGLPFWIQRIRKIKIFGT